MRNQVSWRSGLTLGILAIGLICQCTWSIGAEYPFGYIYTTDTQPKGKIEVEQWITNMRGQSRGDYNAYLFRTELEYGVTDNFQASIYANYNSVNANANSPDGETSGRFVPDAVDPGSRYRSTFYDSTSLEFIWRLLSPYKDAFGFALYLEPTYGPKKREIEAKLIFDKTWLDDSLVWAANVNFAQEQEKYPGIWENESEFQFLTGISYRFAPKWSAGLEYRYARGYGNSFANDKREFSAQFLGPTIHYASKRWWATATWLPQIRGARSFNGEATDDIVAGRLYGEHFARNEFRVRFGFGF